MRYSPMNFLNCVELDLKEDVSPLNAKRILMGILLLAAVVRLWGIWHGYPYSYYPDEAHFVKRALSFGSGDLNPHWFHKPAFYMYLLFFEYGLFYLAGKVVGTWSSINEFAVFYIKEPGPFYLIGRVTTALFSVASIIFTYLTAKQLFNRKLGLLAALLLTLSLGHVMVSKDIKADTPCMFFTIVAAYFLVRYMKTKWIKHLIFSAAFAGMGAAVKYYSTVMLAPIIAAIFLCLERLQFKGLVKGTSLSLTCVLLFYLMYFICSPYNFVDPLGRKWTFISFRSIAHKVEKLLEQSNDFAIKGKAVAPNTKKEESSLSDSYKKGVTSYASELRNGLGLVFFSGLIIGLILIIFNLNRSLFVFFLFPILFSTLSVLIMPGYSEIRHQVVLYPFLVVGSAVSFAKIIELCGANRRLAYATLLILLIPLYHILNYNVFISKEDTRNIAKRWIEAEIPANSKILIDENGPQLYINDGQIKRMIKSAEAADPQGQFTAHFDTYLKYLREAVQDSITYELYETRFPWWRKAEVTDGVHMLNSERDKDSGNPLIPVGVEDYEYYRKNGFEYVIVHSNVFNRFLSNNEVSKNFPSYTRFYRQLFEKGDLVKEFSNENGKIPGPVVKVFRIM